MPTFCFNIRTWYIGIAWDAESVTVAFLCFGLMWDREEEDETPPNLTADYEH